MPPDGSSPSIDSTYFMDTDRHTSTVEGHLERVTYTDEETHFTIAKLKDHRTDALITVIGTLPHPNLGETLKITGSWEIHPRYGEQLRIHSAAVVLPATVDGIRKYLESGAIGGIGPKTAARLIQHFGEGTLDVIENSPHRLCEVKGIGKTHAANIHGAWKTHHALRGIMQFLQACGVRTSHGAKIFQRYGAEALEVLKGDPYRLAADLPGAGFLIADAAARYCGAALDGVERATACLLYLLQQETDAGHVFATTDRLQARCRELFDISAERSEEAIDRLVEQRQIVVRPLGEARQARAVYPIVLWEAESTVAQKLLAMLSLGDVPLQIDTADILDAVVGKLAVALSETQTAVLTAVLSRRVAVITGGPGTGKTTLIRSLTAVFERMGSVILLAAPTGRAARRLSEVTGRRAETLHKMLGYSPQTGVFEKTPDHPLTADAIIIDEASMVDIVLMAHLLRALHLECRLILVGDAFQLPPVGAGSVLADLIASGTVRTFELTEVFRQARQSPIVGCAHQVRAGRIPDFTPVDRGLSECCFIEEANPEAIVRTIIDLCTHRLPDQFEMDPINDIQVLTPMHRGRLGTLNLNQVLQGVLNPAVDKTLRGGGPLNIGDKVMHLKNNYEKEVFNGDIGRVVSLEGSGETLWVAYEGRRVSYDLSERDEIALAYAISVHKSQGSEYPAVIVPLTLQHYPMLQRNLLYTAISRGKKAVVLIGTRKALNLAVGNDKPQHRLSGLVGRLG